MKVASWNIRGFPKPLKQKSVQSLGSTHKIDVFGILESKIDEKALHNLLRSRFPGIYVIHNFDIINKGQIFVLWNPSKVGVNVLCVTEQAIHFTGCFVTWSSPKVCSKWDTALVNNYRFSSSMEGFAEFLIPGCISDHATCIKPLQQLNIKKFSNLSSRAHVAKVNLDNLQLDMLTYGVMADNYGDVKRNTEMLLEAERLFIAQKKKIGNNKKNAIVAIQKGDGLTMIDPEEIAQSFLDYYTGILGCKVDRLHIDHDIIAKGPCIRVLTTPITIEEIEMALRGIDNDKSPRADGFGASFFKSAWNIIKSDVCVAVIEFFSSGRLRGLLGDIVDEAQAAFVKGRSIADNIHLAQELMRKYARKRGSPRCILQVDIHKAYETVDWDLLHEVLNSLNFPRFIQWIMECVTTTSYSITINGHYHGKFDGKRGLRQGDPLSPLLFSLCLEVLSRSLKRMSASPDFGFHPKCGNLRIIHLAYADDLLLLSHGDKKSIMMVMHCLSKFGDMADLRINALKSKIFMASMDDSVRQEVIEATGFEVDNFEPLTFSVLVDSVASKAWNHALLAKTLWKIHARKDCLWIKWVNHIYISFGDIWNWQWRKDTSPLLKQIIDIREEMIREYGSIGAASSQLDSWFGTIGGISCAYEFFAGSKGNWPWKPPILKSCGQFEYSKTEIHGYGSYGVPRLDHAQPGYV
ncbi:uncharacterized protein [Primulina eburnea]|uniref:uncharacterized protein n=1 Tax=Primulina eburnea TaxID=1245227 RepID=UPI003C6C5066